MELNVGIFFHMKCHRIWIKIFKAIPYLNEEYKITEHKYVPLKCKNLCHFMMCPIISITEMKKIYHEEFILCKRNFFLSLSLEYKSGIKSPLIWTRLRCCIFYIVVCFNARAFQNNWIFNSRNCVMRKNRDESNWIKMTEQWGI